MAVQGIAHAQTSSEKHNAGFVYHAKKIATVIQVDGVIDEPAWQEAEVATNFYRVLPVDTGFATQQSEIRLAYDETNLYIAVTFFDTLPGKRVMESFRRDFSFGNNDNFLVFIDPFLDHTTGYSFGVSASGAKWDGTMANGSSVSLDWDCKWRSETRQYEDRWVSEMSIPFKSIKYPAGGSQWNINFSRLDLKSNQKSAWAPVPRQFPTASLAHTGTLVFDAPLPHPRPQLSVIPYVFGSYAQDKVVNKEGNYSADFGIDAKIGISSSMNLDLTYNPDFAQVEVDQQITNIDRFELFFPEKRQFFLENSDLFTGYGEPQRTPFFSRRIGLDAPVLGGGENYNAEVGFIRRTGYNLISPAVTWLFVPNRRIVSHGPTLASKNYFSTKWNRNEQNNSLFYLVAFRNRSELNFGYERSFVQLDRDFDPTQNSPYVLPAGSEYNFGRFIASYQSTAKRTYSYAVEAGTGGFYSGDIQYVEGQVGFRIQPYVNMSMNINYTDIDLPEPFMHRTYWLVGPKLDVTFTDKIFWTLFVQYNEQIDNVNVNMRFQWRYQPVSDIFLVYTDNYTIDGMESRNRALVFKMTYWLN